VLYRIFCTHMVTCVALYAGVGASSSLHYHWYVKLVTIPNFNTRCTEPQAQGYKIITPYSLVKYTTVSAELAARKSTGSRLRRNVTTFKSQITKSDT
jgi:hypothetical protein